MVQTEKVRKMITIPEDNEKKVTVEEAGRKLSEAAQLTAEHSKNWDNFEQICVSILRKAYQTGYDRGYES